MSSRRIFPICRKIYDESQRLITLIGDIIKLSRLDENQVPMERETVDMLEMARDVVQQLSSVARKNGVTLVANGSHGQVQGVRQVLGKWCITSAKMP